MGQAKQRQAEIKELKAKNPNKQTGDDLNNYMYSLGDGEAVDAHRLDLVKGLIRSTLENSENRSLLVTNSLKGKTSSQSGFGFCLGNIYKQFNEIHLGQFSGCDTDTMLATFQEFLDDENACLDPCISFEGKTMSKGWGWVGTKGTLSIKWFKPAGETLTMVGVVSNATLDYTKMDTFNKMFA
jgi:hypothetical protein